MEMAMSPNCVDTEQIPSKMVAGDREILGIGENPKSFGESRFMANTMKIRRLRAIGKERIEGVIGLINLTYNICRYVQILK